MMWMTLIASPPARRAAEHALGHVVIAVQLRDQKHMVPKPSQHISAITAHAVADSHQTTAYAVATQVMRRSLLPNAETSRIGLRKTSSAPPLEQDQCRPRLSSSVCSSTSGGSSGM